MHSSSRVMSWETTCIRLGSYHRCLSAGYTPQSPELQAKIKMPPRRTATRSPTQSMLSFRTPGKITKSQTPHSNFKKDVASITKKLAAIISPSSVPTYTAPSQQSSLQSEPETEEECIANSLDEGSILTYYEDHILASRITPPMHQEELPLEEKVLRHFDLSLQYGPCIGISRLARWKRAKGLGMEPPVEVLAVCLKTEKKVVGMGGKAHEGASGEEMVGCGLDRMRDPRMSYLDDFLSTRTARE